MWKISPENQAASHVFSAFDELRAFEHQRERVRERACSLSAHGSNGYAIWPGGCNFRAPYLLSRQGLDGPNDYLDDLQGVGLPPLFTFPGSNRPSCAIFRWPDSGLRSL